MVKIELMLQLILHKISKYELANLIMGKKKKAADTLY